MTDSDRTDDIDRLNGVFIEQSLRAIDDFAGTNRVVIPGADKNRVWLYQGCPHAVHPNEAGEVELFAHLSEPGNAMCGRCFLVEAQRLLAVDPDRCDLCREVPPNRWYKPVYTTVLRVIIGGNICRACDERGPAWLFGRLTGRMRPGVEETA